MKSKTAKCPRPFVKWVGGKSGILKQIIKHLPASGIERTYYEPFAGGGAVFFELYKRKMLKEVYLHPTAYLFEKNEALVDAYNVIKDRPQELIGALQKHASKHDHDYYYEIREDNKPNKSPLYSAARFIYLNKTCFNGLHRENKRGEFNVPIGSYKNPKIVDEENIMAVHEALKDVDIRFQDFESFYPCREDFIYLDPPYYPVKDNSFTKYSRSDFQEEEHIRLRDFLFGLKCKWMLTNSDTPEVRKLYSEEDLTIISIKAPRAVAASGKSRRPAKELIIRNY
jgi:DNA adenine methylase